MIDGVRIRPLDQICDDRGRLMHMLRSDAEDFEGFGEVYFSTVYPGAVKAWHLHRREIQHYAVPSGMVHLVMYDARDGSPTKGELQHVYLGEWNYVLVRIPSGVVNGFKCVGDRMAIVCNCPTIPFEKDDVIQVDPKTVPRSW